MEPLDNPAWYALGSRQADVALGDERARRYRVDIDPIAGVPDEPGPEAWAALAALHGSDGPLILLRRHTELPSTFEVRFSGRVHQMVARTPIARPAGATFLELTASDDEEMLALARETNPGPFAIHTRELGEYIGLRDEGRRLVAMAGQRMRLPGYTEVSAVCTLPDQRGRGLAAALTAEISARIFEAGDVPFLHVLETNEGARRIYERMGFETRAVLDALFIRPVREGSDGGA
ncbi:MAG: GNAT family N-acetyltransferase [Dehalococcoidia bacterium]